MVLENGSSPGGPNSFDDVPRSDDDPYASNQSRPQPISFENLPQPMPIFGRLFGYNEKRLSALVNLRISAATATIKRPLTTEEIDCLTYHSAKQAAIMSYSSPIGFAAGAWRSWNTASKFRFPFFQPPLDKFDPQVFINSNRAFLRGSRAVIVWHALRTFWYCATGGFIANMLVGSYSLSVAAVGELTDPRLKNFVEDLREVKKQQLGRLPNARGVPGAANTHTHTETQDYGDASPTAGMNTEGDSGLANVRAGNHTSGGEQPQWRSAPPANSAPAKNFPTETESQPFNIWDDASPTGGSGVSADTRPSQPTGSAWDRIRQGERPAAQPPRRSGLSAGSQGGWQRTGENPGERLAFSSTEGEKSHEKEDAQRKFDAQVDRERRGGDFSSGAGEQKRW
ncbi:uncharacterized protein BP5553_01764 [Venustampulla echinocandica]|uniref:Endo-1,3(4)-beta-glucanase n=1 Tax=Venustampulla echinocandica TaxID=2656787 RepID=A0A370U202_9HELO|nr:uncharacterized protein BP5553_01764 [Venustampulla echinocandica]RDL41785.1 hypothetical protein BP5553_01764 [Venustampulla echinocandica]